MSSVVDLCVTEAELTSHLEAQGQREEGDHSHIVKEYSVTSLSDEFSG